MSDNVAHALSGAGGGIISMAITYPLLSISSRLQTQRNDHSKDSYKNTLDAFVKILQSEGLKGLYSGFNSGMFGIAVTNGVYYYCYEAAKSVYQRSKRPIGTLESMVCGTIAGIAVVLATHPIWTVNTRISVQRRSLSLKSKRPSSMQVALYIMQKEGLLGLYSGAKAALVLVINPIIQYAIFEKAKQRVQDKRPLTGMDFFFLGAFSKLCATVIMYPYILIKSRMQMSDDPDEKDMGVLDMMKRVIHQEGVLGLYKGLNSKLIQSVLTSAFLFYAKEMLFDWSVWLLVLAGARKSMNIK